jgi:hypothetical protein
MRSVQFERKTQARKYHQRNGPVAQGAGNRRDGAVEEIAVEDGAVRMFVDQCKSCDVRLRRAKSNPAIVGNRLDEFGRDPIIVLGDEDSFSAQHDCHLVQGRTVEMLGCAKPRPAKPDGALAV